MIEDAKVTSSISQTEEEREEFKIIEKIKREAERKTLEKIKRKKDLKKELKLRRDKLKSVLEEGIYLERLRRLELERKKNSTSSLYIVLFHIKEI